MESFLGKKKEKKKSTSLTVQEINKKKHCLHTNFLEINFDFDEIHNNTTS